MIKAVLLDVDGTLIDSNDAHANSWVEALAESGVNVEFTKVRELIGMGGDHLLPHLTGISKDGEPGATISRRRGEIFRDKYLPTLKAFPGVRTWLDRMLGDGLKLVVATSASKSDLEGLLGQVGLDDILTEFTTSDDAERSKPDPDIVASALKKAGVPAAHAVMIGDTPYDLEAAARAGVPAIAFTSGGWPAEKLKPARAVFGGAEHILREYDASPLKR